MGHELLAPARAQSSVQPVGEVAKPSQPRPEATAKAVEGLHEAPKRVKKEMKLEQSLIMSEVQLLLAEKRTAFALLRTGVTVSLVPLSIWTVLVATSKLYDPFRVWWLLAPVMIVAMTLFALGIVLITRALRQLKRTDVTLGALRQSDTLLEDLLR